MAAMLMEIKSRLLLPRPPSAAPIEDDPRAELVRRLLEYERMKKAAQGLDELPQVGRDVIAISVWIEKTVSQRLPDVNAADLAEAWRTLLHRARLTKHHRVSREELSVREHMSSILRALQGAARGGVRRAVRAAARRRGAGGHFPRAARARARAADRDHAVRRFRSDLRKISACSIRLRPSASWRRRCSRRQEPLGLTDLKRLFDDELGADTLRTLLDELARGVARTRASSWSAWPAAGASRRAPSSSPISTSCSRKSRRATRAR